MRAAKLPPSSHSIDAPRLHGAALKFVMAILSTLALLMVWRPSVVHGQDTASTTAADIADPTATHTVKVGETLWGLAARYYGDGHKWQSLARRNNIAPSGAAPLRVGMTLTVPARRVSDAVRAAAPADSSVPAAAVARAGAGTLPSSLSRPAGALAAQTSGKANLNASSRAAVGGTARAVPSATEVRGADQDTGRANLTPQPGSSIVTSRGATRIGLTDGASLRRARKSNEVETVFHRDLPDAEEAERRTREALKPNTPASRRGEFAAAPFVIGTAELTSAARVGLRIGSSDDHSADSRHHVIIADLVEVVPSPGEKFTVGQRLMSVSIKMEIDKMQRIVVPTGTLVITRSDSGSPVLAMLQRQSGRVEEGQRLLPDVGIPAPHRYTAAPLATPDVETTVRWVDPKELLPTLQSYLLLAAGTAQGVKAGDEFALYRATVATPGASDLGIAVVRVVRSDATGSTAVVIKQQQPGIGTGLSARRVARTP